MTVPYRTRRALRRTGHFLLSLTLCAAILLLFWMMWLGRYVVYTEDGVVFDFSHTSSEVTGVVAVPPETRETVAIYYNDGEDAASNKQELTMLRGYYVQCDDLRSDFNALRDQLFALPDNTPIMLEVKDIYGYFYYATGISKAPKTSTVDTAAVTKLISDLAASRRYLIASIPAFRDQQFGLENTNYGVASSEGAWLYMDSEGCYWLDPESRGTRSYLTSIVNELKNLGFDEVVFTDFSYPNTTAIEFDGDRRESIADAAAYCMSTYATTSFAVSFATTDADFPMPEGRGRLYLSNLSPSQIKKTVENIDVADKQVNLVLLTTLSDTRFDDYSVLRSILTIQ